MNRLTRFFRPEPAPNHAVAVLGMHRSGTSALAGCLEEAGVFLGEVRSANRANPRGNRENLRIIALHKALLKRNGGAWDRPPERVAWSRRACWRRDRIIRSFARHPVWGFKDPRALLCLDGWLEALPELRCVGIFRHPVLVARSLERRNGFPLERGLALWLDYNRRLLHYHDLLDFPLLSFDEDGPVFLDKVKQVVAGLGLGLEPDRIGFFNPDFRHQLEAASPQLPAQCAQLYGELVSRAL